MLGLRDIFTPLGANLSAAQTFLWVAMSCAVVFVMILVLVVANILNQCTQAVMAGVKITPLDIIGMKLRKVPSRVMLRALIAATQAGVNLTLVQVQSHYLAGGHVPEVVGAMIAAHLSKINLPWNLACAMDLAGKDVPRAVERAINSRATEVTFN